MKIFPSPPKIPSKALHGQVINELEQEVNDHDEKLKHKKTRTGTGTQHRGETSPRSQLKCPLKRRMNCEHAAGSTKKTPPQKARQGHKSYSPFLKRSRQECATGLGEELPARGARQRLQPLSGLFKRRN